MKTPLRTVISLLLVTSLAAGCDMAPAEEVVEGQSRGDEEVTASALKMKTGLLLEAGPATQTALGVYAWEVSAEKGEALVLGLARSGARVITARTSWRNPNKDVGRITFHGDRKALKFTFDKRANELKVTGGQALKVVDVINAYRRDSEAGKALRKYSDDARAEVLICGACALGALSCAGNVVGCGAASSATGGLAGLACAARTIAACGTAAIACYVCISDTINGKDSASSSNTIQVVQEGETSDISNICLRNDPCWCKEHPNECFSPVES